MTETETSSGALDDLAEAPPASRRLARILSDANVLGDDELIVAQKQHPGEYLGDVLVREGILLESYLYGLLIRTLYLPWIVADRCQVHRNAIGIVHENFCRERRLLPIHRARDFLTVAMVNPLDEEAIDEVGRITITGLKVRIVLCSPDELETLMKIAFAVDPPEDELDEGGDGAEEEGEEGAEDGAETVAAPGVGAKAAELADQLEAQSQQGGESAAADTAGPDEDHTANEDPEDDDTGNA